MSLLRPHTASPLGLELGPRRAGKDNPTLHTNQSQTINCLFKSIKRDHQTTQDEGDQPTTYYTGFLADDNSAYRIEVVPIRIVATKPEPTEQAEPDPGLVRTKSADRPPLKRLIIDAKPKVDPIELIKFTFAEFDALKKRGPVTFAGQPDQVEVETANKSGGGTSRAQLGWGPSRPPTRLKHHNNSVTQYGTHHSLHRSTSRLSGHPSSLHLGSAPTQFGRPLKRQKLVHPQLNEPYQRPRSILAPVTNLSHAGPQHYEIDSDEEGDGGLSNIKSKAAKSEFDLSYRYHPAASSHSIDNTLLPPPRPEPVPVRVGVGLPILGLNGATNGHAHDDYDEDDDEHPHTSWRNRSFHAVAGELNTDLVSALILSWLTEWLHLTFQRTRHRPHLGRRLRNLPLTIKLSCSTLTPSPASLSLLLRLRQTRPKSLTRFNAVRQSRCSGRSQPRTSPALHPLSPARARSR
jgi:hypothetical protein